MDLYSESRSLVMELWHRDLLQRTPPSQPWIDARVAPMIVEMGRDLLLPLVSSQSDPPIITSFGRHRRKLWDQRQLALPRMTCRDDLRLPRTLVKASWNEFVFAQFTVVPHSVFVPGEPPRWARDLALRASRGLLDFRRVGALLPEEVPGRPRFRGPEGMPAVRGLSSVLPKPSVGYVRQESQRNQSRLAR